MKEGSSLSHFRRRGQPWSVHNKEDRHDNSNNEATIAFRIPKPPRVFQKWIFKTPTCTTSVNKGRAGFFFFLLTTLLLILLAVSIGRTLGIRFVNAHNNKLRRPPALVLGMVKPARDNVTISVVIMNHDRPHLLQQSTLLPTLVQHESVAEVLVLHSHRPSAFLANETLLRTLLPTKIHDQSHLADKVRDIDAVEMNDEMGLALRFHSCATSARNDWVLIVDDDMELDLTAIDALLYRMGQDSKRLIGHYGRSLVLPSSDLVSRLLLFEDRAVTPRYDTKTIYGAAVEVVLTKVLLLERDVCEQFVQHMHLMDDLVAGAKPLWNGEDIFVNLVANRYYKIPFGGPYRNLAIPDLPVWEADIPTTSRKDDGDGASISGNLDDHRIWNVGFARWKAAYTKAQEHNLYRGRFWRTAKERLYRLDAAA